MVLCLTAQAVLTVQLVDSVRASSVINQRYLAHRWKYAVPCQGWLKGSAIIRTLKIGPQVSLSTGQTRNEHLMIAASFFPRARSSVATGNSRIAATELVSPDISNRARYFMVSFGDNHKHLHERQRRFCPKTGRCF